MTRRPNILFITADQWRGDCLGAAGHPVVRTPHLDALAGEGTVFTRHYAACAPCSPARASLYTGLYQMNHRVVANGTPLDARFDNLALMARRAGYDPTLFGYSDTAQDPRGRDPRDPALQGYEEVLPGFTCRQPLREDDRTWTTWLGHRGHGPDLLSDPHQVAPEPGQRISLNPPGYGAEETQTAFLVEKCLDWVGEQPGNQGWFAHVSFLRPHPPFVVPEPYNRMYDPAQVPAPIPAEGPALDHPLPVTTRHIASAAHFHPGADGMLANLTDADFRRLRALYYGMISEVDAQIGRLIAGLKARGQWDNTVVIFTSDHGEMMGDHGLLGKGGFYHESQHIPLILRPAGGGAAAVVDAFTSATDIFPTLAALLAEVPRHAPDGASLLPFLAGQTPPGWRDAALWEFDFRHYLTPEQRQAMGVTPRQAHLMVRRGQHDHYVHFPTMPALYFDLGADPDCRSGTGQGAHPGRQAAVQALLSERMALNDDTLANIVLGGATT